MNPPEPGRRRSSAEVRQLVLTAARELFEAGGFDRTSTRAIAERAGVSATVLFRQFGSKQALYDRALGHPDAEPGTAPRRVTRSEAESRGLLLAAARTLFSAQGYAKTGTRQIAERAGVQEVALFRYFGNKATLFREAIFDPFGNFIRDRATELPPGDRPDGARLGTEDFLGGLYTTLLEQRAALVTLVAARLHEGADLVAFDDQQAAMDQIIRPLVEQVTRDCEAAGISAVNIPVATRLTIAMVGGTAIFKDWLYATQDGISDAEIVQEMVAYVSYALTRRDRPES